MSYIYKTQSNSSDSFSVSNKLLNSQALSSSPSSSSSYSAHLNNESSSIKLGEESHEDLRLIDATMSPISSSRLTSSSSSSNICSNNTRFGDRRVSTSIIEPNPYKFNVNYSAAGQRFAKKALDQLKTVEKSKELVKPEQQESVHKMKKKDYVSFDDETLNDDWQNVCVNFFFFF